MKQYAVTGMACAACSARVEKAVSRVEGVSSCRGGCAGFRYYSGSC